MERLAANQHKLASNWHRLRDQINSACRSCGRQPKSVTLLAVTKSRSVEDIKTLISLGAQHIGESYLQEALAKQNALADPNICWHFIGPIQSNKTAEIAANFSWVHSVDRLKIARRLDACRPSSMPPLNICLQVNIDREQQKSGCAPEQVASLAQQVMLMPNLRLRGLMAIPAKQEQPSADPFRRLANLAQELSNSNLPIATLSMGMSQDFELAIAAGATIVRIGSSLYC